MSSPYACPRCTGPRDTTPTVIYQHRTPPASVGNNTGIQFHGRPKSGIPAYSNGLDECFFSQPGCGPMRFVPQTSAPMDLQGRMTANSPRCPTNPSSKRSASAYTFRDKEFIDNPVSSLERFIPPASQITVGESQAKRARTCNSTGTNVAYHESTSKSLRNRISERYLCGDKSFDEMPAARVSTTTGEGKNQKSPVVCDSTSSSGPHPEVQSTVSCPVKTKSTTESELKNYSQRKRGRQTVDNEVTGFHEPQTSNESIDLNAAWRQYLDGSVPVSGFESGSKSLTGSQPIGKVKGQAITDAAKLWNKTPNEVVMTAKPVQRKLLKDGGSFVTGGYALDYASLPKIAGVLPSNLATAISGSLNNASRTAALNIYSL